TQLLRAIGLAVACLMFLLSLGCGTIVAGTDKGFLLGFVCLLFGMEYLAWYANPFIVLSGLLLLLDRPGWSAGFGAIAITFALSTFWIREIEINEAGHVGTVTGYGLGFYLWIGCCIVLWATSLATLMG